MKFLLCIVLIFCVSAATTPAQKQPFSVSALQYLLERKEFERFDFYIASYLRQYPDTAVLHLLKGYRYFEQARNLQTRTIYTPSGRTGGIPRKYPAGSVPAQSRELAQVKIVYDDRLVQRAFASMSKARSLESYRLDLYLDMCRMAITIDRPDILLREIDMLIRHFGYVAEVPDLVLEYSRSSTGITGNNDMITLLTSVKQWYPDNAEIMAELGKYYYFGEFFDSAFHYMMQASTAEPENPRIVEHTIRLAALKAEFAKACSLSVLCYRQSGNVLYLEQAAIFALAFDSTRAGNLHKEILAADDYVDSLSITRGLFEKQVRGNKACHKTFFTGALFHLNFPMIRIYYNRDRNKLSYYQNKACAFYVYGMYDSAAYYNLNLLRSMKAEDKKVTAVLFNLAAEYFASGQYRLSYFRFLDLYRFYGGWKDVAVHYGLGLNYELVGDLANARQHYLYVVNHKNDPFNKTFNLNELALARLKKMDHHALVSCR